MTFGRTTYGVLAVNSAREEDVSERELAVLGELGELVGHGVNAVRSRRLLTADDSVELEFVCDEDDSLGALAAAAAVVLDIEGVTPLSGSDLLVDARIEDDGAGVDSDPPLERLVAVADEEEAVVEARERGTTGDRVELTMAGESVLFPLIELGARIRSLSTSGGRTRTTAEVPPGTEVRAVVERVEATVPSVRLVVAASARTTVGGPLSPPPRR